MDGSLAFIIGVLVGAGLSIFFYWYHNG